MKTVFLFIILSICFLCLENAYADSTQTTPMAATALTQIPATIMHIYGDNYGYPLNFYCSPNGKLSGFKIYGPFSPASGYLSNLSTSPTSTYVYAYYCSENFWPNDPTYQAFVNYTWVSVNQGSYPNAGGSNTSATNVQITNTPAYCGPGESCSLLLQKAPVISFNLNVPSFLLTGTQSVDASGGGFATIISQNAKAQWLVFLNGNGAPFINSVNTNNPSNLITNFANQMIGNNTSSSIGINGSLIWTIWLDNYWPPANTPQTLGLIGMTLYIYAAADQNNNWASSWFCDSFTGIYVTPALFGTICSMPCNGQPWWQNTAISGLPVPGHTATPPSYLFPSYNPPYGAYGSFNTTGGANGYYEQYSSITCQ